jgi:hypothetical protein
MWLAARRIETAEIREIGSNGYQAALAGAQRKISNYLLLCGGTPYVADGEPVYVGSHIAGIGADRTARVQRDWTNYQARNSSSTLRNFCRGEFYRADEFGDGANRPYIESLRPDLVRVQSAEVQLDAFFRCALECLETKDKFPPADEVHRRLAIFSDVADQDLRSPSISRDRLVALNYFLEFVYKSYRRRYAFDPFADFELFARTQKLVSDPCNVALTKQEGISCGVVTRDVDGTFGFLVMRRRTDDVWTVTRQEHGFGSMSEACDRMEPACRREAPGSRSRSPRRPAASEPNDTSQRITDGPASRTSAVSAIAAATR